MGGIIEHFWHCYIPTLILTLGIFMSIFGLYSGMEKVREQLEDPGRASAVARCLRIGIICLSLVGVGIGWLLDFDTLLLLSLIICCEEFLKPRLSLPLSKDHYGIPLNKI